MKSSGQWKKNDVVWLPCRVKGGPFPNERRVYIKTGLSEWFGFVNVSELKKKIAEGEDEVRAVVIEVSPGDLFVLGVRGQSPKGGSIQTRSSEISAYGAV